MAEQPLNLKLAIQALWRCRLLVCVLVVLGAAAGAAYGFGRPPEPTAAALILLPPSSLNSAGTPTRDMTTEAVIATSSPVLAAAGRTVHPPIGATTLKHHVVVTALSQDVLQVQVHYPKARDAERLADAVAADYIRFVTTSQAPAVQKDLTGLQQQAAHLTKQIQSLQSQINDTQVRLSAEGSSSTQGQQDSTLLTSLRNEQNQASLELDNVNNQIATAQLSTGLQGVGTSILQKASSILPASHLRLLIDGAIGAGIGLLGGILLVVVRASRDHRLRLRGEIAATLGVPIIGSLHSKSLNGVRAWNRLLNEGAPSPADAWTVRRILSMFSVGRAGADLRVVAFSDDLPALVGGAQVAAFAARLGMPTVLRPNDHRALMPLRASAASISRPESLLRVALTDQADRDPHQSGLESEDHSPGEASEVTVSLTAVDRNQPTLEPSTTPSLLAVSSGSATADDLARLALAMADAFTALDGVLLINPDPHDATSNTGSKHTHTQERPANGSGFILQNGTTSIHGSPLE